MKVESKPVTPLQLNPNNDIKSELHSRKAIYSKAGTERN